MENSYGGHQTGILRLYKQNINEISTDIPMFSGFSNPNGFIVMLRDQIGSGNFKIAVSNFNFVRHLGLPTSGLVETLF